MSVTVNTMKLSKHTLTVLKNFSSLNSNLLVKPGNTIKTVTPAKNVAVETRVLENFPIQFGIWDMNKFLGTISLFEDPEFEFNENCVYISGKGGAKVAYYYSEPKLLTTFDKEVKVPNTVVHFDLTEETFNALQRAASILQLPDLCVRSTDSGEIELAVLDKKYSTTNNFTIPVGDNDSNSTFNFYFKIENLKLLVGDYSVSICKSVVSKFEHKDHDLTYYVALETDSNHEV